MFNLNTTVLFRASDMASREEKAICSKYFNITDSRSNLELIANKIVVGRYSVLPYYKELENDLKYSNSRLINSYQEHRYVADLKNWALGMDVDDLQLIPYTPRTWTSLQDVPDNIPLVLKGETNSRKDKWSTHMFAQNKKEAIEVYLKLRSERFLENQEIYIREYIKLNTLLVDEISGQPISKEFRFFCCGEKVLASGFYWSSHVGDLAEVPSPKEVPQEFIDKLTKIIARNVTFYVMDIAQTQSGDWILIELNDGQMSGLSEVDPDELYSNLKQCLS